MNFKSLEEKCNYYRSLTDYRILPNSNILVMLDGKNFSRLIKNNFALPFDDDFIGIMNRTAEFLCSNVQGAKIAYVQSDEISILITDYDKQDTDTLFGGRICKIQSVLASLATSEFNRQLTIYNLKKHFDEKFASESYYGNIEEIYKAIEKMKMAQFDCKVWNVPCQNDVYAWFLYRQLDCIRNSKQQAAHTYIRHQHLAGKNTDIQIEMLKESIGIDWNTFKDEWKYGRFIYKNPKELTTIVNGETINYVRNKFTVFPAYELSLSENKQKFIDTVFAINKKYI